MTTSLSAGVSSWSNDSVAVTVFLVTVVAWTLSYTVERRVMPGLFFAHEVELKRRIAALLRQAEELHAVENMTLYSTTQRRVAGLRRELAQLLKLRYTYTFDVTAMLMSPVGGSPGGERHKAAPLAHVDALPPARRRGTAGLDGSVEATEATSEPPAPPSGYARQVWAALLYHAGRGYAQLPPRSQRALYDLALYVHYNLPYTVKLGLRVSPLVLAWLLWGERTHCVQFPDCLTTRLVLSLESLAPAAISYALFGLTANVEPLPLVAPRATASQGGAALAAPAGLSASAEGTAGVEPAAGELSCSSVMWAVMCIWLMRYAARVFF